MLTGLSQDVVLACGCSGALELALDVLLNPGDNVLLPKPGFSIYQTLSISRGHEVRHYNLLVRHRKSSDYKLLHKRMVFVCCTHGIKNVITYQMEMKNNFISKPRHIQTAFYSANKMTPECHQLSSVCNSFKMFLSIFFN